MYCLRHNADRKCYKCKTEFPNKDLINLKRPREEIKEDDDEKAKSPTNQTIEESNNEEEGGPYKRMKISTPPPEKRTVYLSLKDDQTALKLESLVQSIKAKSESIHGTQKDDVARTRKNAKENMMFCLLLGAYEAREKGGEDF